MSLQPREVDFFSTWSDLKETVRRVVTMQYVPRAVWNDRFSDVYSLCVAYPEAHADKLYDETQALLEKHVRDLRNQVQAEGSEGNIGLLKAYHSAWLQYSNGIVYLSKLYSYLNMQHIKKQQLGELEMAFGATVADPNEPIEIGELGLRMWKREMIEPLKADLIRLLLEVIEEDRKGKPNLSLTDVMKDVIQSLVDVQHSDNKKKSSTDYYEEIFETPFLQATGEFYKREAAQLMQDYTISQYLEKVIQRLNDESLRVRKFVHPTTYAKAKAKCEQFFVSDHLQALQAECDIMVREERKNDLRNIYPLLRPVANGLSILIEQFYNHVRNKGLEAINNLRGDNIHMQFVENMLAIHKKYKDLIEENFQGDQALVGAMDRACSFVVNHKPNSKQPCRSPELLAKYCDTLLKKSSKGLSETEIDDKLSKSIIIFRYIDDKDIYQKFYSKMLARRLIHQQSHSMDAEEAMINKLKQACGFEFTNKLHRMYTDVSLSTDLNAKFQEYLKDRPHVDLGVNFQIHVLQAGAWPLGPCPSGFHVPQELVKSVQAFEDFYKHSFNGRRLTWYHHLCQGELKLSYLSKPYIISMQTFQMAILLLFEKTDTLTGQDLMAGVELGAEQVQKQIQSLIDAKLINDPGQEFSPSVSYSLNLEYSNKRTRFKISAGALQQTQQQEVHTTLASVEEDRKLVLQAAIVRIMKSRKVLKHTTLVQELLAQKASFQPSVQMIKKCIEALIDKQYIERTPQSQDEYSYVA